MCIEINILYQIKTKYRKILSYSNVHDKKKYYFILFFVFKLTNFHRITMPNYVYSWIFYKLIVWLKRISRFNYGPVISNILTWIWIKIFVFIFNVSIVWVVDFDSTNQLLTIFRILYLNTPLMFTLMIAFFIFLQEFFQFLFKIAFFVN